MNTYLYETIKNTSTRQRFLLLQIAFVGLFFGLRLANSSAAPGDPGEGYIEGVQIQNFSGTLDIAGGNQFTTVIIAEGVFSVTPHINIASNPQFGTTSTGIHQSGPINAGSPSTGYAIYYNYITDSATLPSNDTFEYQVCINTGAGNLCQNATISLRIINSMDISISSDDFGIQAQFVTGTNDTGDYLIGTTGLVIDVLANDTGPGLVVSGIITPPSTGTATAYTGNILYQYTGTTIPDESGITFVYQACNSSGCDNATVTIVYTISGITLANDTGNYIIGTTGLVINVLANDIGNSLVVSGILTPPSTGTATVYTGYILYQYTGTTIPNATGIAFEYQACNNTGCDNATITILYTSGGVTGVNDTATFNFISGTGTTLYADVLTNDTGAGIFLSGIVTQGTIGQASKTGSSIAYTYTGNALSTGTSIITYQVCNFAYCNTATLTVSFTGGSVLCYDNSVYYQLSGSTPVSSSIEPLNNDYLNDVLTSGLVISSVTQPTTGTTEILNGYKALNYRTLTGNLLTGNSVVTFGYKSCQSGYPINCASCNVNIYFRLTGSVEDCRTKGDEDGDGLADCKDTDCENQLGPTLTGITSICQPSGEGLCEDDYDNDGDNARDCDDNSCSSLSVCTNPKERCNNRIDDDSDGKTDCTDPDCAGKVGGYGQICEPNGESLCADGLDNDVDGLIDCNDSNCSTSNACTGSGSEICNNQKDDDADGLADCTDPDCSSKAICQTICGNGVINAGEKCDDGALVNGDGCSSTCQFEKPSCDDLTYAFGSNNEQAKLTITASKSRYSIMTIDWTSSGTPLTDKTFPISNTYTAKGTYNIQTKVVNTVSVDKETITCSKSVTVNNIPGCTDKAAGNYNPNATSTDDSCTYKNNLKCSNMNFRATTNTPGINEQIFFLWDYNKSVTKTQFYPGIGSFQTDPTTPVPTTYTMAGTYKTKLIIYDDYDNELECSLNISVTKKGCTDPTASNYDPTASQDDGLCEGHGSGDSAGCGNGKLDEGEECDDYNKYNGDGCNSICQMEEGRVPYCGNSIVELGEECDGGVYCNERCIFVDNDIIDSMKSELCFIDGSNCQGGANGFLLPGKLPIVGPDEKYIKKWMEKNGRQVRENPKINTKSIDWYPENMNSNNPYYNDPIYRIENILPAKFQNQKNFIVIPSINLVTAVGNIEDPSVMSDFILGKPEGIEDGLKEMSVHYYGSSKIGEKGNTIIYGHSSQFYMPNEDPQKSTIGNVFKLLSLVKHDDTIYTIEKVDNKYKIASFKVQQQGVIKPEYVNILKQDNEGNQLTLLTCHPVGKSTDRYVVIAKPQSSLIDINYDDLIDQLSLKEKISLRSMAEKMKQKHQQSDQRIELLIHKISLLRETNKTRTDISPNLREQKDIMLQYLIYHLILDKSTTTSSSQK